MHVAAHCKRHDIVQLVADKIEPDKKLEEINAKNKVSYDDLCRELLISTDRQLSSDGNVMKAMYRQCTDHVHV